MPKALRLILALSCVILVLTACAAPQGTPPPTLRPTTAPTPTVPVAAFSDVTLLPSDMPPGFVPQTSSDSLIDPSQSLTGATLESQFGFIRQGNAPELITGATMRVPDPANQVAFDLYLSNPNDVLTAFVNGISQQIVATQTLPGLERLGDSAAGMSLTFQQGKEKWNMELVVFRAGQTVVYLGMAYRDGDLPPLPLSAYAYKLAERAKRVPTSD